MTRIVSGVVCAVLAAIFATAPESAESAAPGESRAPSGLKHELEPWRGDFDGMLERRVIRVLVPYSRTLYFNDKGAQRGLTAEALRDLEPFLEKKFPLRGRPFTVVTLPTTRDRLLPGLVEGRGDIAAGVAAAGSRG